MKVLRWMLRPDLFTDVLERVNVLHFGTNRWLKEMTKQLRLSYPMISYFNLWVDHRIDKVYELQTLERELRKCYY